MQPSTRVDARSRQRRHRRWSPSSWSTNPSRGSTTRSTRSPARTTRTCDSCSSSPSDAGRRRTGDAGDRGADGVVRLDRVAHRPPRLPEAFVRPVAGNPGFGTVANEVLRLVEGEHGLFLVCHDDIALDPDALRLMVEELYRSNAGHVGPKLVDWDDPRVLQSVGMGVDRFGEIDHSIELGEVDQEQHDGVRDVFACRAHACSSAPTCSVSSAASTRRCRSTARTSNCAGGSTTAGRGSWWRRRPGSAIARNCGDGGPTCTTSGSRRSTGCGRSATLTGGARLPGRSLEMVLLTIAELVVGVFTATFGQAWASLRALVGLDPAHPVAHGAPSRREAVPPGARTRGRRACRCGGALGSRRTCAPVTSPPTSSHDATVRRWQRRHDRAGDRMDLRDRRRRRSAAAPSSPSGVPAVGEFLPFPRQPTSAARFVRVRLEQHRRRRHGGEPDGLGDASPAVAPLTLFRMGLLQTLLTVGLLVAGVAGMWKFATVFPSTRARVGGLRRLRGDAA